MTQTHTFNIVPLSGDAGGPHKRFFVNCYLNGWLASLTTIYHQTAEGLQKTARLQQLEEGMRAWLKCTVSVDHQDRRDQQFHSQLQLKLGAEMLTKLACSLWHLLKTVCLKDNALVCQSQDPFSETEQLIAQNNYICASLLLKEALSLLMQIKQDLKNTNLTAIRAVATAQQELQNHAGLAELSQL